MGITRHSFSLTVTMQVFAAGATAPSWEQSFAGGAGTTTVLLRFDDPFETGFVRAFDEASRAFLGVIGSEGFQAALPGGDLTAAANAASGVAVLVDEEGERKVGTTGVTADDLPAQFAAWDPEVYGWGGKDVPLGFLAGAIGTGLLIGGDQIARATALNDVGRVTTLAPVLSTLLSANHLPYLNPNPGPEPIIKGMVGEFMFDYGVQIMVPSFGITVPTLIAASLGSDIQTTKAVMGFASLSFLVPGITMIRRFAIFPPEFSKLALGSDEAYLHVVPAATTLAIGAVDVALAAVSCVFGVLYATDTLKASPTEQGLIPIPGGRGGRLKNAGAFVIPMVAPTQDEGISFSLVGRF